MVHSLRPGQLLPVTPKGSVRRKEAERQYEAELCAMYERLENGVEQIIASDELVQLSDEAYVLRCVQQGLSMGSIAPTADFHSLGLDSRKAVRMRSALMKRFGKFPLMFIFEYSSVPALSTVLTSLGRTAEAAR